MIVVIVLTILFIVLYPRNRPNIKNDEVTVEDMILHDANNTQDEWDIGEVEIR